MKLFFYCVVFLLVSNLFASEAVPNFDSLFTVLEEHIQNRKVYDSAKEQKINALKILLPPNLSPENKYKIHKKLISEYSFYNFDSCIKYLEKNINIGQKLKNDSLIHESRFRMAQKLMSSGRDIEAVRVIGNTEKNKLSNNLKGEYYRFNYEIYNRISDESALKSNKLNFKKRSQTYYDSLLTLLPKGTGPHLDLLEREYFISGEFEKSLELNTTRITITRPSSEYYPLITFYRGVEYHKLNNLELAKKYYIISAILDIQRSRKNNAAIAELAAMLYQEKKFDQANRYINLAMDDARFYNSKYRFLFLSKSIPVINEAYQYKIKKQKNNLRFYGVISTGFSILFLTAVILLFLQYKKLSAARNELRKANLSLKDFNVKLNDSNIILKESNHIKEQYIAHFLEICSKYIDKLDNYRKMVNNEIGNKKVAELFEITKSKRNIEKEQAEFYNNFDKTFLAIYPSFVKRVNELLLPDEQITLKSGELLNTELRIFALIRLGVQDSSKIARLLRYSVNTIYNYRAQIKNKAKGNRELFEQHILEIGAKF